MPWIPLAAAGVSAIGGLVSGNATRVAQNKANDMAAKQAEDQQRQQLSMYLLSRGINPGTIPGLGGEAGSYANTVLPLGANINGVPAEQLILQNLFGRSGLSQAQPAVYASEQNIEAFLQAHPDVLQQITDNMSGSDDARTPAQWLRDHVTQTEAAVGGGTFTNYLKDFAQQAAGGGSSSSSSTTTGTIPPEIEQANKAALASISKVYNGGFLGDEMNALKGITDARTGLAQLGYDRNNELRAGAGNIYNAGLTGNADVLSTRLGAAQDILGTQLGGLDSVLGARRTSANDILGTELGALGNLRGVGETGANNIYGAELTGADTYENAVKQAVSRSLEQNRASRALRGFSGDSSGDALLRARTLAGGYQAAGGARAQAGINLQNLLSDVRRQEAAGQLTARSKSATSLGDASIQDALERLKANTGYATTKGSSNELAALARSGLGTDYAKNMAGILDSDAAKGVASAALQNAGDRATVIGGDINRQLGSTGLANSLLNSKLDLTNKAAGAQYADINALMNSLSFLRQTPPPTPNLATATQSPTINSGQIIGSGLSSVGSGLSDYYNSQSILNILRSYGGSGGASTADSGGARFNGNQLPPD